MTDDDGHGLQFAVQNRRDDEVGCSWMDGPIETAMTSSSRTWQSFSYSMVFQSTGVDRLHHRRQKCRQTESQMCSATILRTIKLDLFNYR